MTVRKEIQSSVAVVLFGVVFLLYAARYPMDTWACPGPGVFPLAIGAMLLVLAVHQLWQALWKWKRSEEPAQGLRKDGSIRTFFRENPGEMYALGLTGVSIFYILGIQRIGFFVSTFLYVFIVSRLSRAKSWVGPVLLSAGVDLFCYLMFVVWQKLNFPNGLLF